MWRQRERERERDKEKHRTQAVLDHALLAEHRQDLARAARTVAFLDAANGAAPDVSEIAIPALGPLGHAGIPDAEAAVERHAVRRRVGPVHGRLALLAHRRRLGLARQQHGVGVGVPAREQLVRDDHQEQRDQRARVGVPLPEEPGHALVQVPHEVVEDHGVVVSAPRSLTHSRRGSRGGFQQLCGDRYGMSGISSRRASCSGASSSGSSVAGYRSSVKRTYIWVGVGESRWRGGTQAVSLPRQGLTARMCCLCLTVVRRY